MRRGFVYLLFVFLIFQSAPLSYAKALKIFMVQSYSNDDLCGPPQLKGALDVFEKANITRKNTDIRIFFMEAKTKNTTKPQRKKTADKIYNKIIQEKPDLVMLFDDVAFMELAPRLLNTKIKVVFSGVNRPLEEYNKEFVFMDKNRYPTSNMTGVYEKLHIVENIKFIYNVLSKQGNIAVVSSTDIIGKIVDKQIKLELEGTQFENSVRYIRAASVSELINALNKVNADDSIIAYVLNTESIYDGKNNKLDLFGSIPIALKYAKKPDLALNTTFCEAGLFGGMALNSYSMGEQAAKLAVRALNNIPIKRIRIEDEEKADRVINIKRAKQLNIKIPIPILNSLNAVY